MYDSGNREGSVIAQVLARDEFHRLHRRALIRTIVDRLFKRRSGLRPLHEVTDMHPVQPATRPILTEVPVDRIVGSVNRSSDYTRGFLPRVARDEERWAHVKVAIEGDEGLPPPVLYEVNGQYFVADGHHRVSVFKALGVGLIEAYVTVVQTGTERHPPRVGECCACSAPRECPA